MSATYSTPLGITLWPGYSAGALLTRLLRVAVELTFRVLGRPSSPLLLVHYSYPCSKSTQACIRTQHATSENLPVRILLLDHGGRAVLLIGKRFGLPLQARRLKIPIPRSLPPLDGQETLPPTYAEHLMFRAMGLVMSLDVPFVSV